MKFYRLHCLLGLLLAFTGCESISDRVMERFDQAPLQSRPFAASHATVYAAAQKALKRMDFMVTRSALAQGIVNARSGQRDTAKFGSSRQFLIEVHLRAIDDSHTEVGLRLSELLEGDFKAGATEKTIAKHGLYDSFYEQLTQALREAALGAKP